MVRFANKVMLQDATRRTCETLMERAGFAAPAVAFDVALPARTTEAAPTPEQSQPPSSQPQPSQSQPPPASAPPAAEEKRPTRQRTRIDVGRLQGAAQLAAAALMEQAGFSPRPRTFNIDLATFDTSPAKTAAPEPQRAKVPPASTAREIENHHPERPQPREHIPAEVSEQLVRSAARSLYEHLRNKEWRRESCAHPAILRELKEFPTPSEHAAEELKRIVKRTFEFFPSDQQLHRVVAEKILEQFEVHGPQLPCWGRMAACFSRHGELPEVKAVFEHLERHVAAMDQTELADPRTMLRVSRLALAAQSLGRVESPIIHKFLDAAQHHEPNGRVHSWELAARQLRRLHPAALLRAFVQPSVEERGRSSLEEREIRRALDVVRHEKRLSLTEARALVSLDQEYAGDRRLVYRSGIRTIEPFETIRNAVDKTIVDALRKAEYDATHAMTTPHPFRAISELFLEAAESPYRRGMMRALFPRWLAAEVARIPEADECTLVRALKTCTKLRCMSGPAFEAIGNKVAAAVEPADRNPFATHERFLLTYLGVGADLGCTHRFAELLPKAVAILAHGEGFAPRTMRLLDTLTILDVRGWSEPGAEPKQLMKEMQHHQLIERAVLHDVTPLGLEVYTRIRDLAHYNGLTPPPPLPAGLMEEWAKLPRSDELGRKTANLLMQCGAERAVTEYLPPGIESFFVDVAVFGPYGLCCVEVNGRSFHEVGGAPQGFIRGRDLVRDAVLERAGYPVVRAWADETEREWQDFAERVLARTGRACDRTDPVGELAL